MRESWAEADAYEPYMGRWSRAVARALLAWLNAEPGLRWCDVGCGTGALTHAILALARPRLVLAADRSHAFVAAARARAEGEAGRFVVADALALPVASATCDVAASGLVLNFVPDPAGMVRELIRVLRPGGRIALYVWDYAEGMELLRHFWAAAASLDPAAVLLDEGTRFPLCRPGRLRELFVNEGVSDVEVRALDVPTDFRDFDAFWSPFLGGQGPAPGYVSGLGERERIELRELVRARLPRAADGSISLVARAWAVRGRASRGASAV